MIGSRPSSTMTSVSKTIVGLHPRAKCTTARHAIPATIRLSHRLPCTRECGRSSPAVRLRLGCCMRYMLISFGRSLPGECDIQDVRKHPLIEQAVLLAARLTGLGDAVATLWVMQQLIASNGTLRCCAPEDRFFIIFVHRQVLVGALGA